MKLFNLKNLYLQLNNNDNISKVLIIFLFSFLIRFLYSFITSNFSKPFIEDESSYFEIAYIFLNEGFFSDKTHYRVPITSIIILPIIKFFEIEKSILFVKFLMIILSSFSCVLIFLNCVELGLNKFRSFLTSIFYSIYPFSIYFSSRYLSETLTEFILLIISLTYLKYSKLNNFRFLFFLAILFGLLTLTRSAFYYLFLLMIFLMFFEKIKFRIKLTKILFLFSVFYLTLSPWIIKNYIVHGEFVPTSTRLGYGLWLSNNDFENKIIKNGGYSRTNNYQKHIDISHSIENIFERSDYLKRKSIEQILENKKIFPHVLINRLKNMLNLKPNPYEEKFEISDYIMIIYLTVVYIFFMIGIFTLNSKYNFLFLVMIIFYTLIIHLPFYGIPRFRFPVDSYFIIISCLTFFHFKKYFSK